MDWQVLERHFSAARLGRYRDARAGDLAMAALDYSWNLRLAEALVPMLNAVEIALRNSIHSHLCRFYGRPDWWEAWVGIPALKKQCAEVEVAKKKLRIRNAPLTPDKILAELTFGFWSSLFNTKLQLILWKPLRLAFAHCPKPMRQRDTISVALNQIRELRNRVFHHEPLIWLTPALLTQYETGITVIGWIGPELQAWLDGHDRFPAAWRMWQGLE